MRSCGVSRTVPDHVFSALVHGGSRAKSTLVRARNAKCATQPLFDAARSWGIAISFGYAELTPDGRHFNTSILTDKSGKLSANTARFIFPGTSEFDSARAFQHLEKRYFEPGDLGFNVWSTQNA